MTYTGNLILHIVGIIAIEEYSYKVNNFTITLIRKKHSTNNSKLNLVKTKSDVLVPYLGHHLYFTYLNF